MNDRPIICLTPIYNEAHRLKRFLLATSLWADHIILADQMSDDGSREIAAGFPKVIVVDNKSKQYDEGHRKRLLTESARKIAKNAIHVALDADEFLTGNFSNEAEWAALKNAPSNSMVFFPWLQVTADIKRAWHSETLPFAYIDDSQQAVEDITFQGPRIPLPAQHRIYMNRVGVLHYHYVDHDEMWAKIKFYQCYECVVREHFNSISLYRFYNKWQHLESRAQTLMPDWQHAYQRNGVDMTSFIQADVEKWHRKTLELMETYGANSFRKAQVWDIDWQHLAHKYGFQNFKNFEDPRSLELKIVHRYLRRTQNYMEAPVIRKIDRLLEKLGF